LIGNNAGMKLGSNDSQEANSENNVIIGNEAGENITLGNDLLFIGRAAGQYSTQGQQNTYIGNYTGQVNNGSKNTFIGSRAGYYNKGDNNTIIGTDAGRYSETASFNTLIGYEAGRGASVLQKNVGEFNTAIGYQSGQELTTGYRNLYLGYQAGQRNKEGAKNIMIGPNAGLNSRGSKSIFIGAAESNTGGVGFSTTGELNVLIGPESGVAMTSGERNVLLGSYAGQNATTASSSVLIGTDAGQSITTGDNNVLVGPGTGQNIVTGTNNIMVGDRAGNEATNGASENILIGTLAGSKTEINESINIGNKAGQNNQTGIGNILIGRHAGQKFEQSRNNIMIGSNAGASFYPTGDNITLGENIYIGPEVGRDNVSGIRNIVIGSEAFKSSVQGGGVIAIGYKAGASAGVLAENVGGMTYDNTIIGFEAGSQGDFARQNVMIGAQSGRNVDNGRKFEGNVLLGSEAGKNSNLSVNSVVLGSANKIGGGGVNNVIAGTTAGNNLGVLNSDNFTIGYNLEPGLNSIQIINTTYADVITNIRINDRILVDDGERTFEGLVSGITEYLEYDYIDVSLEEPYRGTSNINAGATIKVLANIDNNKIGDVDQSKSSSNTLMGNQSAVHLTTGSKNVALGDQSMHTNEVGKYNNILGTQAAYNAKTDNNTVFGTKAGYYLDSYIGNTNAAFTYTGFSIEDNTIYFEENISNNLDFGTIIDIENTTGNNDRYKILETTSNSITVEGTPRIEELGVSNTIDPDSIIVSGTTYNFVDKSVSNQGFQVLKSGNGGVPYSYVINSTSNIGEQLSSVYQVKITGSKYNDGVHYLYKDETSLDNTILRPFDTMYPEVFDSSVIIETKSVNTSDTISTGFSFQDINPNAAFFAFLGSAKGVYRVENCECKYSTLKPLKNTIAVDNILSAQENTINNVFTLGHIEDIDITSTDYLRQEEYVPLGDIKFFSSNNNIVFANAFTSLNVGDDEDYYIIKGTQNNDMIVKILSDVTSSDLIFNVSSITGSGLVDETITSTAASPVVFKSTQFNSLSKDNSDIFTRGSMMNLNITHSLGQKVINGCYLVEGSYSDNNMILLSGNDNTIIPELKNEQNQYNIQNENLLGYIKKNNINLKFNKEIYNVDSSYLEDTNNHINGYDLMFQTGNVSVGYPITLHSSNNHITSGTKYCFKDIVSPCMIKIDSSYYLVKSNKYPFQKLEIDSAYTVSDDTIDGSTDAEKIFYHSVSTYQNGANLALMEQGTTYKIFGNERNHLVDITPVSDSSAIHKQSVYLTSETSITNQQGNNRLMIVESRHDDYDFASSDEPSEGFGRGYFKHLDITGANVNILYDNISTQYERLAVLDTSNSSQKEYLFIKDIDTTKKKYNLIQLDNVTSFENITSPDYTFDGTSNLNTIVLPGSNTFTFMGEAFSNIQVSTYGYLYFEGTNHSHVYNFLTSNSRDLTQIIDPLDNNSNIQSKIIDSSTGTNDVLLIDFTSNVNGDTDYTGNNNCQLQLYLDNADYRSGRIYSKYSNVSINTIMNGLDSTEAIIKENRLSTLLNNSNYDTPLLNINSDNYTDYNNKKITLTNNKLNNKIKLTASDGADDDKFGNSVAIYGDYIVIGAYYDDDNGTNSGSVYVYKRDNLLNTFTEVDKLTASDGAGDDKFGNSVSIYGDYIVIGSITDDNSGGTNAGSAYVFKRDTGLDTFTEVDKLTASDGASYDYFGNSVVIYGDYIVIGAYDDDDNGPNSGSVYVFKRDTGLDTFTQVDKLTASDGAGSDNFGNSVAIYNDYIVIGAFGDDDNGSAYVFKRDTGLDTFTQVDKLTASDGASYDNFGNSVSIYDDYIVIGAFGDDDNDNGPNSGSAYVFKRDTGLDTFTQVDKLTASDGTGDDNFGNSVSIYGNYIVIGAYYDDDNGPGSGSAYVFKRNTGLDTFTQVDKLIASDGASYDNFSNSVSIYDDYIVIGVFGDDDNGSGSGSAYVYLLNDHYVKEIIQHTKLIPDDTTFNDYLGYSVAIYGDYIVIGAYYDDDNGTNSGSAYVYKRDNVLNTFTQVDKLTASDGAGSEFFGYSVAIYGDYIVIGAYTDDNGSDSGSAYVFKRDTGLDTFTEVDKLTASDGASYDYFGTSVSIYGDYIVIGSITDDDNGLESGSAYVFKRDTGLDTFTQVDKLTASDGASYDYFGNSVVIYGDYIVIGAHADDDNGSDSGSAYVFKRDTGLDTFTQVDKLTASDGAGDDKFGYSVAIYGDYIVIGAYVDDDNGSGSGSAYVFKRDTGLDTFTQVDKLTASDGAGDDNFGYSVSIYGNYIVIGAYADNDNGTNSGSSYVFKRDTGLNTFTQVDKLIASDGASYDNFGNSVSIYGDYIVIGAFGDDDNGSGSGSAYVFGIIKNYNYSIANNETEIDKSLYTVYNTSLYNTSNLITGVYSSSNLYVNINGYILLNDITNKKNNTNDILEINNYYLSLLNNIEFSNIYINEYSSNTTIIYEKNNNNIVETVIYPYDNYKIEISLHNLDTVFTSSNVNTTLGVNLLNENEYISNSIFNLKNKKIINFNNLSELNNIDLITLNDIIQYGSNSYQVSENNNSNILIYNSLPNELFNQEIDITINEYVGYDENTSNARIDFSKIRQMTGEHSDFLRFIKMRQSDLREEYGEQEKTVDNYSNVNIMDKGLNFSVDTSVFETDGTFNSNINTTYVIPLKETVPNEYLGSDTANTLLRQDYYAIALGEPVFEATTTTEELININTPHKGHNDVFVRDNRDVSNNKTIIYNSNGDSNEIYTGQIEVSATTISLTHSLDSSSKFVTNKNYSGIKSYNYNNPFNVLKPGNIIFISKEGTGINGAKTNSTYMVKEYSTDGITIDIEPIFNDTTTSSAVTFSSSQTLKIELSDLNITTVPANYGSGHIINERYNFSNFSNISAYDLSLGSYPSLVSTRQYVALSEYPILNNNLKYDSSGNLLNINNFINYSIPEWGFKPMTSSISEFDESNVQVSMDFFYNGYNNLEEIILDNGSHTCIVPTSNITQNINSTNIFFKDDYFGVGGDITFNVDNYTVTCNDVASQTFCESLNVGQIIRIFKAAVNLDIRVQVLSYDNGTNILTLDQTYPTKLTIDNFFANNGITGDYNIVNFQIFSDVIMSSNTTDTDLSVFKSGQRIRITNTDSNNGIKKIDTRSYTTSVCLMVDSVNTETPSICSIERIVLQPEVGQIKSTNFTIDATNNTISKSSTDDENLSLSSFTTNQIIALTNTTYNNSTYTTSSTKPTNSIIYIADDAITDSETGLFNIFKKIMINIVGQPISSTIGQASLFHYGDAQGNNMMLGSFTGQFCGYKNLAIHNTYIGNKVGQTNHGSGNMFFGSETGLATAPTDGESFYDNKFAVYKNNFIGVPDKPLIGGDFGSGRVGINTINPDSLLTSTLESTTRLVVNGAVRASAHSTFTGTHIITLSSGTSISDLTPGMIMSSTGKVNKLNIIDTVVECSITSKEKDKKVFGIYASSEKNGTEYIHYVAGVGEGQIWVSNIAGDVEAGDYVCASAIPGYTQLQDDDLAHNYTVAKITEDIDWTKENRLRIHNDNSYKVALMSCVYMCS
jgi:hypothetical protein